MISTKDAVNVAKKRGISYDAQLLVADAYAEAAEGVTQEEWIAAILSLDADNPAKQLEVMESILKLQMVQWWPWPDSGTDWFMPRWIQIQEQLLSP